MSIRSTLWIGLVAASLALGAGARAEDPPKTPHEHGGAAHGCDHHVKAMHGMHSDAEREAYCRAHADCMSHNCGGMAAKGRPSGEGAKPAPKSETPKPKK